MNWIISATDTAYELSYMSMHSAAGELYNEDDLAALRPSLYARDNVYPTY
jgi:hypothetical protein